MTNGDFLMKPQDISWGDQKATTIFVSEPVLNLPRFGSAVLDIVSLI